MGSNEDATKIDLSQYSKDYILEVLAVYRKIVAVMKSDAAQDQILKILPFSNIFDIPEFKEQFDKILGLLLLSLLEMWKDIPDAEKKEMQSRLDNPSLWEDKGMDPKEEWKLNALILASISQPGIGSGKIAFNYYLQTIRELEKEIGSITFISATKELTGTQKDKYLAYFFSRIMEHEFQQAFRDSFEIAIQMSDNKETMDQLSPEDRKKLEKILITDDQTAIDRYKLTFDFMFENFVHPIFKAIEASLKIPRHIYLDWKQNFNPFHCPKHLQLKAIRKIFEQSNKYEPLHIWTSDLNVRLRNSLIHEKYYIRDQIIHYYFMEEGKNQFKEISVKRLKEINAANFMRVFIIPVVIALKLIQDENLLDGIL